MQQNLYFKYFRMPAVMLLIPILMIPLFTTSAIAEEADMSSTTNAASTAEKNSSPDSKSQISIIFSHDMHSHLDTEAITRNGGTVKKGGFAKLSTAISSIKRQYPDSLILDAGDFSMGTPYQTIFTTEAAELRMMGMLGYDATTFGNHEFDYRARGLAAMLQTAKKSGDTLPALLSANIDWDKTLVDPEKQIDAKVLKKACEAYGAKPYTLLKKSGKTIAVFGILGKEADAFAPESGLYFKDPIETSRELVKQIQEEANPDFIICLSHSGTFEQPEDSEDEILAAEIPEINLIISGHSHTELPQPIQAGNTVIASCGSYTYNLGHLVISIGEDGNYSLSEYRLIPLDHTVKEDPKTLKQLKKYRELTNRQYFSQYGYQMEEVLATNSVAFSEIETFGLEQGEEPLGSLIADSYINTIEKITGNRPDVAIVPAGVVRGTFGEGNITVADAFNVSSLGTGKDGTPGYPLVTAYLTGKELKAVAEVDATISDMMPVARLYCSGISYRYNPNRLFLNRAVDVRLTPLNGQPSELEDDKLYQVAGDLYSCQMLGMVKEQSFGLLFIEPKDADGTPITDYEEHILYDETRELKAWYALAAYIDSFAANQIPDYYHQLQGRKQCIDTLSPTELLKQPNKIAGLAAVTLTAVILLIAVMISLIRRRKKRNRIL